MPPIRGRAAEQRGANRSGIFNEVEDSTEVDGPRVARNARRA